MSWESMYDNTYRTPSFKNEWEMWQTILLFIRKMANIFWRQMFNIRCWIVSKYHQQLFTASQSMSWLCQSIYKYSKQVTNNVIFTTLWCQKQQLRSGLTGLRVRRHSKLTNKILYRNNSKIRNLSLYVFMEIYESDIQYL